MTFAAHAFAYNLKLFKNDTLRNKWIKNHVTLTSRRLIAKHYEKNWRSHALIGRRQKRRAQQNSVQIAQTVVTNCQKKVRQIYLLPSRNPIFQENIFIETFSLPQGQPSARREAKSERCFRNRSFLIFPGGRLSPSPLRRGNRHLFSESRKFLVAEPLCRPKRHSPPPLPSLRPPRL